MTTVPSWMGRQALALLGVVAVAAAGAFFWLRGSLPEIDGVRALPGLAAPVEVVRDEHGVPHILAESEEDALFALGFVHAQDRMWQMEMNRRIGAGRISEVVGSAALGTDRLLRVLGLHRRAKASLEHLSPESRRSVDAYVAGVNAWLETRAGPLPPEFMILGFEPAPWSAADTAVWPKLMSLDLSREWARDRMRLRLSRFLPPDRILDFYTPYRADKPRGVVPRESAVSASRERAGGSRDAAGPLHPAGTGAPESGLLPIDAASIDPASIDTASVDPASVDPASVDPASVDPASVDPASVDPASVDPASVDPASVDPASVDPASVDPASVDPASVDPASVDPASVDPASVDPTSSDRFISGMRSALPPSGGHSGSNSWVVDGTRSATGKPLLANDPHLGLTAPSVWYLAHLSWPGVDVVGATFPGMPVVVLGHNGHAAWGFTNAGPDVQDLFVEQVDAADPSRYLAPGGPRAFDVRRERIRVKDGDDVTLEVRESRHGPILDDAWSAADHDAGAGRVFALAWTALREDDLTLQAGLGLAHARDWESFVANARDFHSPQQNITYADVNGNIGYLAPGLIPIRSGRGEERPGTMPRPGWDASHDWQGFVPFDELPRVDGPAGGVIVTANHRIVPDRYPYHLTFEWAGWYRAQRIMEKLGERARHDVESFRALQQDRVSLFARALLPRLRRVPVPPGAAESVAHARRLLDGWDGAMDPDRPEPLIFHAWIWEFGRLVSADELGALQRDAWSRKGPFIQRVLERREVWCDDGGTAAVERCDEMLARALAVDRIARDHGDDPDAWRWGDVHVAISRHRPFGETALAPLFNLSGAAPGSIYAVNAFSFSPLAEERPFASTHGPGFRAIYDLADLDRSLFIHSTGQSGNVLSPLYRDFEEVWRDGGYVTVPTKPAAFRSNALGRLRLVPQ